MYFFGGCPRSPSAKRVPLRYGFAVAHTFTPYGRFGTALRAALRIASPAVRFISYQVKKKADEPLTINNFACVVQRKRV
jgi:hypothetical protein